jgi:hypothetical protein
VTGNGATPPTGKRIENRGLLVALVVCVGAVALLLAGVLVVLLTGDKTATDNGGTPSDTFDVNGSLELASAAFEYDDKECFGWKSYDDLNAGAQVVIRDATGSQVGLGSLGPGYHGRRICTFEFTVEDVPSGSPLYSVEIAGRGEISFPEEDADSVALTVG